jgi:hypothetical protein
MRDAAVIAALVSALVGGVTSILVARMQAEATHEQAAAVFVGVALEALKSRDSTNAETRAWAVKIINYYSPIPLTPHVQLPNVVQATMTAGQFESVHGEATVTPAPTDPGADRMRPKDR